MDFCVYISLFLVLDNAITLFNYFFRNFRGFRDFRDFRGFDLATYKLKGDILQTFFFKIKVD